MLRALEYTWVAVALSMFVARACAASSSGTHGQTHADRASPLAYARRLVVAPVRALKAARPQSPQGPGRRRPPNSAELSEPLVNAAAEAAAAALVKLLGESGSTIVATNGEEEIGSRSAELRWTTAPVVSEEEGASVGPAMPDIAMARRIASTVGADGVVCVALDRSGIRQALFREVWVRLTAYVVMADAGATARGPVYALGVARTAPRLVGRGFLRTDEDLVAEAAETAAARLYQALDRGHESPFAADMRVAVVPAAIPDEVEVRSISGGTEALTPATVLGRQADALFMPDIGPVATTVTRDEVKAAMQGLAVSASDLWSSGAVDAETAGAIGRAVRAEYVFASRVESAAVSPDWDEERALVTGEMAEVIVNLALVRVTDLSVVWRTVHSGSARTTMLTADGRRRIRTREQCLLDATAAAYAHGRFSLEDWSRGRRK